MHADRLTSPKSWNRITVILSALMVMLFAITNWPWTLDDYDQAKQAFVSDQMIKQGRWLYQTTPQEGLGSGRRRHSSHHISAKPPAVAWISAGIFGITRSWDLAWRLPSFAAALALAYLIYRTSVGIWGSAIGLVALAAFALNILSARLSTLVRTDMPLALVTFATGLLLFQKVRTGTAWSNRDRWALCGLLTAGLFVKGPIIYAFVLPPLVLYQIFRQRRVHAAWLTAWSGGWPWLVSLALFLCWVAGGIRYIDGFYEDVVRTEFAGRFHEGVHRSQPLWFYLPHLLQKLAPWSLLSLFLGWLAWRKWRRTGNSVSPTTFWLITWALGGVIVLSLLPSKRVDRIFPAVPPLCLLLAAQLAAFVPHEKIGRWLTIRRLTAATLFVAGIFTCGYSVARVFDGYRSRRDALEKFGRSVRALAAREHLPYEVAPSEDEGLLLYLQRPKFIQPNADALATGNWVRPLSDEGDPSAAGARIVVEKHTDPPARYGFFVGPPAK